MLCLKSHGCSLFPTHYTGRTGLSGLFIHWCRRQSSNINSHNQGELLHNRVAVNLAIISVDICDPTSLRTRIWSAAFRYCSWWVTRIRHLFFSTPQMHLINKLTVEIISCLLDNPSTRFLANYYCILLGCSIRKEQWGLHLLSSWHWLYPTFSFSRIFEMLELLSG